MPRRNRNAQTGSADIDTLAAEAWQLAREIRHEALCAACRANLATEGGYCAPCKGQIILSARKTTVKRR